MKTDKMVTIKKCPRCNPKLFNIENIWCPNCKRYIERMIRIVIDKKTPTINHLYFNWKNRRILTREARDLKFHINEYIKKQKIDTRGYENKKLRVIVEVYENWMTKKGVIVKKDILDRQNFLIHSIFESLDLEYKNLLEHTIIKKQDEKKEESIIFIEVMGKK